MTIKKSIDELIEQNSNVHEFIQASYRKEADQAILDYVDFLRKSSYNSALGFSFADVLRFCNDPAIEEQFENEDVDRLFGSLLTLNSENVNLFIEAAKFAHERMNDSVKAKRIIDKGINELEVALSELKELASDFNS